MNNRKINSIFEPVFTYDRAADYSGEWDALKVYLRLSSELMINDEDRVPPLITTYHRYQPNIAVLYEENGQYVCHTIEDGAYAEIYDCERDSERLQAFCERHRGALTVLEGDRARTINGEFEAVSGYVAAMTGLRRESNKYRDIMRAYQNKMREFRHEHKEAFGREPETVFPAALELGDDYLAILDKLADVACSAKRDCAVSYLADDTDDVCSLFGLFIYAIQLGHKHSRHLKSYRRVLSQAYAGMLDDLHRFIMEYPDIEDIYANTMHLPANERARLHALLEDEDLFDEEWGYIGNDLF